MVLIPGEPMVTESAEATALAAQAPFHAAGGLNATPVPLPGQLVAFAVNVDG
jgi:hypothetical protein